MSTAPVISGMNMPEADPLQMQDIQRQQLLKNVSNAAVGGQVAPQLAPQQAGGVKSYLGDLLYNIGEYTKKRYGLVTDYEKQQNAAQIGIAQQKANTEEGYKNLQGQAVAGGLPSAVTQEQADMYKGFGVPVAVGTMLNPKQHVDLMKQALANKGKTDTAQINQGVPVPVTPEMVSKYGLKPGSTIGAKAASQLASLEGKNIETKSQMINGQPHQVIRNKVSGEVIHDMGIDPALAINAAKATAFANAKASLTPFQSFDADGNLVTISAGQAIASGAPGASAWNTLFGATGSTKSQGQAAGAVAEHIPQFQEAVRKLDARGELGPVMGRINTYLAQGYGGNDKDIAEFVTTLGLLNSGAVRAHFGAKGGAQILDKFNKMLNPAMTANDLIGSTNSINDFLNTYKATGSNSNTPKTNINSPAAPSGGGIKTAADFLKKKGL